MINEEILKLLILEYHPNINKKDLERLSEEITSILIIEAYNLIRTLQ